MSRFVLDCALSRPVSEQAAGWLSASVQRAWAPSGAGYHEGKRSDALLRAASADMAAAFGAAACQFEPTLGLAVTRAVEDAYDAGVHQVVATTQTDSLELQQGCRLASQQLGLPFEVLGVGTDARVDPDSLAGLQGPAILVTAVGNQEIGVLQADLAQWASQTGSGLVWDVSTCFGWSDLPALWERLVVDPRAWGAPAGACAALSPSSRAATGGFDNVAAAVAAALCTQVWAKAGPSSALTAGRQIERIKERVLAEITGVEVHGGSEQDLPHILSVSVLYVDAEAIQTELDAKGFAVGSGSACASRSGSPSHVLAAIGGLTAGNIRIGLPPDLGDDVVDAFVDALVQVVAQVRAQMGTDGL